jgi:hypothetical protein
MFTHCHSVANTKAFARSPAEHIKRFLNDRSVNLGQTDFILPQTVRNNLPMPMAYTDVCEVMKITVGHGAVSSGRVY